MSAFDGGAFKTIKVALEASTAGYVGGMDAASKATQKFAKDALTAKAAAEAGPATTKWDGFVNKTSELGSSMSKNVTLPILAFAGVAVAAFEKVDHAYHTIEQRTGATGNALKGLKHDFDAVAATTGASFGHVADVMSQLNQRLGLAGKPLQDMTRQFLTLERVAGTGAPTVDGVTKAMVAWNVSTGNQSTELDKLFVASQKTGAPLSALVDDITRFAPIMRAAGLNIDQATVLLGSFEKAGVPVSKVMMGITSYLAGIAKGGGDASGAFQGLVARASELYKVGKPLEAAQILVEALGKRSGLVVAQMIRDGRLSGAAYDALNKAMGSASGEIAKVGAATLPLGVQLHMLGNQAVLALAPIGAAILPKIQGALSALLPVIRDVVGAFSHLTPLEQNLGLGAAAGIAAIGPLLKLFTWIVSGATTAAGAITSFGSTVIAVGSEVASFVSDVGLLSAGLLGIAAIGTVAIGFTMFKDIVDQGARAGDASKLLQAQVKSTGGTLKDVFGQDLRQTMLGKSLGQGGILKSDALELFNGALKDTKTGFVQLDSALTGNHKQWTTFRDDLVNQVVHLDHSSSRASVFRGQLDDIRKGYIDAQKAMAPYSASLDDQTKKQIAASLATEATTVSTKQLSADAQALAKLSTDANYTKALAAAGKTMDQVKGDAASLGLTVQDMLDMKTWSPKNIEAAVKAMDAFTKKTSDMITGAGAITQVTAAQLKKGGRGIVEFYQGQITENDRFTSGLMAVSKKNLDPTVITQLLTAGPAKANPILHELLKTGGDTLIAQVNVFSKKIEQQATIAAEQSRLLYLATQDPTHAGSDKLVKDLAKAQALAFKVTLNDNKMTDAELAFSLGIDVPTLTHIASEFGITWQHLTAKPLPAPTMDPLKPPNFTGVLNDYKSLTRSSSSIIAKGAADIASQFGNSDKGLTAAQAKLRDTLILNWVLANGGTNKQAQDMIDKLDGKFDDLNKNISDKQTWMNAAMKLQWQTAAWNAAAGGRDIGQGLADGMASKMKAIGDQVHSYAAVIKAGLDPVLIGIGGPPIPLTPVAAFGAAVGLTGFHNRGGLIDGDGPDMDSVPAMLTPREFVVRRRIVDTEGAGALHALNEGRATIVPRFNNGGQLTAAQISQGMAYGDAQAGKPYIWGGTGPGGFDCSGLASSIIDVILGQNPRQRIFTSASISGAGLAGGLGQVAVGAENAGGKGHVAMTINGRNYEATPPSVRVGPGARGADDPMFTERFHLGSSAFLSGGGSSPGGFGLQLQPPPNLTGAPWLDDVANSAMNHTYLLAQAWANAHTAQGGDPTGGGTGLGGGSIGPINGGIIARIEAVIKSLESGGNYSIVNSIGAAGAYQFLPGTWHGLGGPGASAADASPAEQDAIAGAYISSILARNGGNVESVPVTWYLGHYSPGMNLNFTPPGNNISVADYVAKWMARFNATAPTQGTSAGFGHAFNKGGMVTAQELDAAYRAYHPRQRGPNATSARALLDQFPNGVIGDFDHDGVMSPKEWHAWKDRKQRSDVQGWNWKDMSAIAGPIPREFQDAFPNGLIGDINQDGKLSSQEWQDWSWFSALSHTSHRGDLLRFLSSGGGPRGAARHGRTPHPRVPHPRVPHPRVHHPKAPHVRHGTQWLTNEEEALLAIENDNAHGWDPAGDEARLRWYQAGNAGHRQFRGNLGSNWMGFQQQPNHGYSRRYNTGGVIEPAKSFDTGGVLEPGWNRMYNGIGRPEILRPVTTNTTNGGASITVHAPITVTVQGGTADIGAQVRQAIARHPQAIVEALSRHEQAHR